MSKLTYVKFSSFKSCPVSRINFQSSDKYIHTPCVKDLKFEILMGAFYEHLNLNNLDFYLYLKKMIILFILMTIMVHPLTIFISFFF